MADPLSMSLEDILRKDRSSSGGRGRGRGAGSRGRSSTTSSNSNTNELSGARGSGPVRRGRTQNRFKPVGGKQQQGSGGNVEGQWSHDLYNVDDSNNDVDDSMTVAPRRSRGAGAPSARAAPSARSVGGGGTGGGRSRGIRLGHKVSITNLAYSVKGADLEDIFAQVGELRSITVHVNEVGRSLGEADIVFCRRVDATSAVEQYNGQTIEGRRVTLTLDEGEPEEETPVIRTRTERPRSAGAGAGAGGSRRGGAGAWDASTTSSAASSARPAWLMHDDR